MGDWYWSYGCRNDVEFYGVPGSGAHYRSRFGTYSVSGGVYQTFAAAGYECYVEPFLGAPVKAYGWIAEMNWGRGCWGQWFENGAIGYHDGRWNIMYGRYGQTGGMTLMARAEPEPRADAEIPPDPPIELPAPTEGEPLPMTRRFLRDLAERVASTYAQTFLGLLLVSGFGVDGVLDLSLVAKAAVAAVPAALSAVKGLLARQVGDKESASLAVPRIAP